VQSPVTAIPLAFGRRLRAQLGTRFAVASLPDLSGGGYTLELAFALPEARTFREKALYAASISCGRSKYLQPIRPLVTRMARVPVFTIVPSADATSLSLPHLFGGIPELRRGDANAVVPPVRAPPSHPYARLKR
jgi:hypothetical protein